MAVYYDYPEDYDDIVDILLKILRPGDAILIKGSRGMRLEKISEGLLRGLEPASLTAEVALIPCFTTCFIPCTGTSPG